LLTGLVVGPRRQWARNALVVSQVAGSLVLLIAAGLFIRTLDKAQKINLGFNPDHVLNLSVDVEQAGYKEPRGREFFRELDTRLRVLPGVESIIHGRRRRKSSRGGHCQSNHGKEILAQRGCPWQAL
jgi:hypothetical protein